jgi:hypothetical protein
VEAICLILILYFFYEGIYKIAYFGNYAFWLHHAPLLKPVAGILQYLIPIGELVLSLSLIAPSYRGVALGITFIVLIIFLSWIMSVYLFTNRLFWPYHALWHKPTWMQKMLISTGLLWLSFIAIIVLRNTPTIHFTRRIDLRKPSANAH